MPDIARIIVVKRDGREEKFSIEKLRRSVLKGLNYAGIPEMLDEIVDDVLFELSEKKSRRVWSAEIADRIEKALISRLVKDSRTELAAKALLLARIYNWVFGKGKWDRFDPVDEGLSYSALRVLSSRYLLKDVKTFTLLETPSMMFRRVARHIAKADRIHCLEAGNPEDACDRLAAEMEERYFRLMAERRFLPNSPTLMNAGTKLGILSACFVVPVRDAMTTPEGEGIYDAVRAQAIIFQQGGGTGFSFSEIRPQWDVVASTAGAASGPLSFMRIFDLNTDVIKQGGRRRGANMGILHVWHPDIMAFIRSKRGQSRIFQNFNISVGMYDWFFDALEEGRPVPLINPRLTSIDGSHDSRKYAIVWARHRISEEWVQEAILKELEERGGSVPLDETVIITWDEALAIAEANGAIREWKDPAEVFEEIVKGAWESGDPGLIFIDEINRRHPTWYLGKINATNPCGEEPLLEWESCNLGSINLERYVIERDGKPVIDWEGIARDVETAIRFLDNVITVAKYPLPQLEKAAKRARKVGLGVMGWAHMLIRLGIRYDSVDAVVLASKLAEWIAYNAYRASVKLAKERGPFPAWNPKLYRPFWKTARPVEKLLKIAGVEGEPSERVKELISERPDVDWDSLEEEMMRHGIRNATTLSIAPTGTISIIAGTSSSIEPVFALAFIRRVTVGEFIEINKLFLDDLRKFGLDEPEVVEAVAETGSIAHNVFMPRPLRHKYRTAHDIDPAWHVLHQASWQTYIDAAVSKTVNLRHEATIDDVRRVYLLAWALGCKGITVYRDRSKETQVITFGVKELKRKEKKELKKLLKAKAHTAQQPENMPTGPEHQSPGGGTHPIKQVPASEPPARSSRIRRLNVKVVLEEGDIGDCATCEY